uniref:Putative secreted protein n=1 Tax=Anopheles marajoara TaxID=58244 RepID=A0A2M4CEE2_9DIPT
MGFPPPFQMSSCTALLMRVVSWCVRLEGLGRGGGPRSIKPRHGGRGGHQCAAFHRMWRRRRRQKKRRGK